MPDCTLSKSEAARLKRRRDELLNTACNRQERPRMLREVSRINRQLAGRPVAPSPASPGRDPSSVPSLLFAAGKS